MDELLIRCVADKRDRLVVSEDEEGLYIEAFVADRDTDPCIKLSVLTAMELRDALNEWIGEQQ